jgi:outer membrane receptor protein involved in Fe transport
MKHTISLVIRFAAALACSGALFIDVAVAQSATHEYRIASESLDQALRDFSLASGVDLLFSPDLVAGKTSLALKGTFTIDEGLRTLLRGSGLEFTVTGSRVVIGRTKANPARQPGSPASDARSSSGDTQAQGNNLSDVPSTSGKRPASHDKTVALQEVIVTGTHIRGAPVSSPVTRITRQEIDRSGYTTVGAVIQSLPDNFGNSGPQTAIAATPNTTQSLSGAYAPNLNGLGPASTLTLVDGQRLADDSVTGSVDISLIPLPVIDHIDVLSGGASAIYGSDAVAGVVNIILYKDFDGSKTTLLGGGTADGGGTERDVNEMVGKTWSGGGTILDYESDVQDPILASQRDYTQSAGSPTTILPGTSRSSFFASAHQDLGGAVSVFGTGLYTNRSARYSFSNGSLYPSETADADVHQFAAYGGLNASLASEWSASVVGDYSEDRTGSAVTVLASPPENQPLVVNEGTTKSLEATANGPIVTIWSGKVRGAAGLGYRRETYNYAEDDVSASPGAHRAVSYAYGELDTPLITPSDRTWRRELALDLSGRFERYSAFGGESVPKIGLVYAPFSTIQVRGTWGKAFQAPSLFQMDGIQELLYFPRSDPQSATGVSDVLERFGGNPALTPQKARTWTLGIDYASQAVEGLTASVTYLDVAYRNLIGTISDLNNALINPLDAPFVIRDPSEGLVQSLLSSAAFVSNAVGSPINPAAVPAIINAGDINVASEDVVGGDVDVRYHRALSVGEIEPFISAALLDLRQKLVPGAPEVEISGLVFQPPKFRARTGVSWLVQRWTITGIVNYSGPEVNTYQPSDPHVASWTTLDLAVAWQPEQAGILGGLKLNLAVENALNRDPPFVQFDDFVPGIHYDSLNANALGRVIRVGASWLFQ